jgi:hypothetical protein
VKAFAGSPEFKAALLAAMSDDIPDTADLSDVARAYGIPPWLAALAQALLPGLPPDLQAKFPQALIRAIPLGADLDRVRDDFAILGLTSALGLDPTIKPAKALLVAWGTRNMDATTRADMAKQVTSLRRMVKAREIQIRSSERAIGNASHLAMRWSAEKLLAARVIACEAARAASYHQTPRAMVEPLATAVAARVWLKTISRLDVPKETYTGNIKARRAATDAAWVKLAGADRTAGSESAYRFLATELMQMVMVGA